MSTQTSQLLPALFGAVPEDTRLRILHLGPACRDTVDFFSNFRCRLQVTDLFQELPPPPVEDTATGLEAYFGELLQLPVDSQFDRCLFWDLFNYLDATALRAFLTALRPHLAPGCLGHGFSVHNPRNEEHPARYGIVDAGTVSLRKRERGLPGYAPHSQNRLIELLDGLALQRSVLLADGRLELLLARRAVEPTP